jgi:hypothetical protein
MNNLEKQKQLERIRKSLTLDEWIVFENSLDCLYCGAGFAALNKHTLSNEDAKRIYIMALDYLGNDWDN